MKKRACTKCKAELDLTPENFYRDCRDKDGLDTQCKKCRKEYQQLHYTSNKTKKKEGTNACVICGGDKGANHERCNDCLGSRVPYSIPVTGADIKYLSEQTVIY